MKTTPGIYEPLKKEPRPDGRLKVEGHVFENKARVMDAINDIAEDIGFVLERFGKP